MKTLIALLAAYLTDECSALSVNYNESDARHYLQYARASFCTKRSLERWDCGDMCDDTAPLRGSLRFFNDKAKQMQGYVVQTSSSACLAAFRGSVTATNYVNDFMAFLEHWPEGSASWCPGCKVHAGVAKSYKAVRLAMMSAITNLSCQTVNFAGHSLGGAVAALASLEVRASLGLRVENVYTFGMLRTGNQRFVDAYLNASTLQNVWPPMWRIVHYRDPVPRVPLVTMGYAHIPMEVYYLDKTSTRWKACANFTREYPEDESCSWATGITYCLPPFADPAFNHNMYMNKTTIGPQLPAKCKGLEQFSELIV